MNKGEILGDLLTYLRWSFPQKEIKEIVRDYDEFFRAGAVEGKSQEQICTELGAPSEIALELAASLKKRNMKPSTARLLRRMAFGAALFLVGYMLCFMHDNRMHILRDSVIIVFGLSAALWWLLGGRLSTALPLSCSTKPKKWPLCSIHIGLSVFIITISMLFYEVNARWAAGGEVLAFAGMTRMLLAAFMAASLVVTIFSAYQFYSYRPRYFALTVHSMGVVFYLNALYLFMASLEPPRLDVWTTAVLIVYALSVVILTGFTAHIQRSRKEQA